MMKKQCCKMNQEKKEKNKSNRFLISLDKFGGGEYLKLSFKVVDKETKDMLNTIVGKHYNLEV